MSSADSDGPPHSIQKWHKDLLGDGSVLKVLNMDQASSVKERDHEYLGCRAFSSGNLGVFLILGEPSHVLHFRPWIIHMEVCFIHCDDVLEIQGVGVKGINELFTEENPVLLLPWCQDMGHEFGGTFTHPQLLVKDPMCGSIRDLQSLR